MDDDDDAFADPIVRHERRASSPSGRFQRPISTISQGDASSSHDMFNRNRSPSDPFADTHGHLNYGYANRRSRTQASLGTLPEPGPSPSLVPLLVNGEGSSAGTAANSILAGKASLSTNSELKKTVPLPPPEDFELDLAGPSRNHINGTSRRAPALAPDSDEEDGVEPFSDQDPPSRRASGFSFGMMGRNRQGSETTGLGLMGPGLDPPPSKSTLSFITTRSQTAPPETPRPHNTNVVSLATPPRRGSNAFQTAPAYVLEDDGPHLRTWTVPAYLSNPEIAQLLGAFPTTISGGSVPRFKNALVSKSKAQEAGSVRSRRAPEDIDLEAQDDEEQPADDKEWLRHGTGRVCLTNLERDEGWRGSMWERLRSWWRRVFC